MKLRLAILLAVIGQLVVGGLCAAVCAPVVGPDACSIETTIAPPTSSGCCSQAPAPVPCDSAPGSPSAPRRLPPCCISLPPILPATLATSLPIEPAPIVAFLAFPASDAAIGGPLAIRAVASAPMGPPGLHQRLATLCVWTI